MRKVHYERRSCFGEKREETQFCDRHGSSSCAAKEKPEIEFPRWCKPYFFVLRVYSLVENEIEKIIGCSLSEAEEEQIQSFDECVEFEVPRET